MFVTEAADLAFKLAEQGQPFSYYAALDLVIAEAHTAALIEDTQHTTTAPQIAAQPVSLVKSAPATYCTGQ